MVGQAVQLLVDNLPVVARFLRLDQRHAPAPCLSLTAAVQRFVHHTGQGAQEGLAFIMLLDLLTSICTAAPALGDSACCDLTGAESRRPSPPKALSHFIRICTSPPVTPNRRFRLLWLRVLKAPVASISACLHAGSCWLPRVVALRLFEVGLVGTAHECGSSPDASLAQAVNGRGPYPVGRDC